MIKLNVCGNVFGIDGYSNHTRSLFKALYDTKEFDMKLTTQLPEDWMKQVSDAELDAISKQREVNDWNLIVTIPYMWKLFIGPGKNAAYCVWEGDVVPKSFLYDFINQKIDLILVPSEHTKQAIINTFKKNPDIIRNNGDIFVEADIIDFVSSKVRVIPHGVDGKVFYSQQKKDKDDGSNDSLSGNPKQLQGKTNKDEHMPVSVDNHAGTFKFICNKGWRGTTWDRGGVQYLLKAYAEEFNKEENVELVLKLNPAYINPDTIKQAVDALGLPIDRPNININCGVLSQKQLNDLYNSADCFVCATRAEAFNLPGLEAMSCGLPTIQTSFGGQCDYMTDKNSLVIDYELSESEEKPMYEGIQWAVPDITSLRKQLRWAFDNQDKIKKMGKQAEKDSKKWSWDNSAQEVLKSLR